MPHGKANPIRNVCKTLAVDLEETRTPFRKFTVEARVYDDGAAFRYVVPNQPILTELHLAGERTEFQFAKDATTYPLILQNFRTSYEDDYHTRAVERHPSQRSDCPAAAGRSCPEWPG